MIPESVWKPLEGLPYEQGASGPDRYDCLGVLVDLLLRWRGVRIDPFVGVPSMDDPGPWKRVTARAALRTDGAAIVTRSDSGEIHVWTSLGGGRVLSALRERGVCAIQNRALARAGGVIVGCYVHEELLR